MCWISSISSFENRAPAPTPNSRVSVFKLLVFFATVSTSTNIVGVPYMIVHLHTRNELTSFMPRKAITLRYFSLIQNIHINVLVALRVTYTSVLNCYMTLLTYTMQQILLESWTSSWLVKKFPALLPCLQQPTTYPYPEPDQCLHGLIDLFISASVRSLQI